jgi:ABC-type Fe3+ transport system permease subunit
LIILLTIFTVNYRNKYFGGYISYKNAFLFGLLAVLVSIVLGIIYNIIFHKFIDPGYLERITMMMQDKTLEMLQSRGLSEDQIEQAMRRFEDQGVPTVAKTLRQSLIAGVIGGVIMSLISAAIGKKKPEDVIPE